MTERGKKLSLEVGHAANCKKLEPEKLMVIAKVNGNENPTAVRDDVQRFLRHHLKPAQCPQVGEPWSENDEEAKRETLVNRLYDKIQTLRRNDDTKPIDL